ncbi:hypothetical protein BDY21DRAFT_178559 [Lineolata rhizophorae]|uniref:Uncharacterized protein n=1 Tax=Lineolata rhizophorae TaxID=578093 RepID=A0A6A6P7L7_9PEZI|nr:hypothetical protein BDY21DRAFT_178559 [Lineolata rhizophorae]
MQQQLSNAEHEIHFLLSYATNRSTMTPLSSSSPYQNKFAQIKQLFLERQYRKCATRCDELLAGSHQDVSFIFSTVLASPASCCFILCNSLRLDRIMPRAALTCSRYILSTLHILLSTRACHMMCSLVASLSIHLPAFQHWTWRRSTTPPP